MKPSVRFLWWYLNTYIFIVVYFFIKMCTNVRVFPMHSGKQSACQSRRLGFDTWVRKILWMRKWQPTPVLLLGESHGQRSLVGYSPQDGKESDMTEWLHFHFLSLSKENLSQNFRKAITKKIQKQELEFNNKRAEINLIKIIFSIDDTTKNWFFRKKKLNW